MDSSAYVSVARNYSFVVLLALYLCWTDTRSHVPNMVLLGEARAIYAEIHASHEIDEIHESLADTAEAASVGGLLIDQHIPESFPTLAAEITASASNYDDPEALLRIVKSQVTNFFSNPTNSMKLVPNRQGNRNHTIRDSLRAQLGTGAKIADFDQDLNRTVFQSIIPFMERLPEEWVKQIRKEFAKANSGATGLLELAETEITGTGVAKLAWDVSTDSVYVQMMSGNRQIWRSKTRTRLLDAKAHVGDNGESKRLKKIYYKIWRSDDTGDLTNAQIFGKIEYGILDRKILFPGIGLEFSANSAALVFSILIILLLVQIRSQARKALLDDDLALNQPWLVLD